MKREYNNNNNTQDPNESQHYNNNNQNHNTFITKYAPQISNPIPISSKKPKTSTTITNEDGTIVEITRRPRGRPPGSKNKPKPPIIIDNKLQPAMSTYILEVQSGSDIIGSLTRYTRRRGISICVLSASGSVSNVTLKQPSTVNNNNNHNAGGGTVMFRGGFDILSLSAVLLLEYNNNNDDKGFGFSVMLGGPQGQIFGGKVVEPLIAATTVYVIATSFNCPNYQRLPVNEDEERVVENVSAGGGSGGHHGCVVGATGGADVMWGPTSKAPLSSPY